MKSNTDSMELTQEELDKIAGGMIPTHPKIDTASFTVALFIHGSIGLGHRGWIPDNRQYRR